jgi:vacuolar-type H+-ATPase subunit C/Vma6
MIVLVLCFSLYSSGNLATFLDYITYSYMIDNIILLITGTLHQRPISELVPKCHPLGSFEQMEAIHVAATPAELYSAVLVDTPLGRFSNALNRKTEFEKPLYL